MTERESSRGVREAASASAQVASRPYPPSPGQWALILQSCPLEHNAPKQGALLPSPEEPGWRRNLSLAHLLPSVRWSVRPSGGGGSLDCRSVPQEESQKEQGKAWVPGTLNLRLPPPLALQSHVQHPGVLGMCCAGPVLGEVGLARHQALLSCSPSPHGNPGLPWERALAPGPDICRAEGCLGESKEREAQAWSRVQRGRDGGDAVSEPGRTMPWKDHAFQGCLWSLSLPPLCLCQPTFSLGGWPAF